jgi:GGDEF domain-containing protein
MLWYIAFVSVLNLGLGYALAIYLGAPTRHRRIDMNSLLLWSRLARPTTTEQEYGAAENAAARLLDSDIPVPMADAMPVETSEEVDVALEDAAKSLMHASVDTPDQQAADEPPAAPHAADPVAQLVTREYAEQLLAEISADGTGNGSASAALLEANWDAEIDAETKERLLGGVARTVRQLVAPGEVIARYGDRQFMLVLPCSNAEDSAQRVEQLRRKVEATKYVADGIPRPATLTCAVASVSCNAPVVELSDMLGEALAEAKRYGGNRTFLHDGMSPTPVVPLELGLGVQQCMV